MSRPSMFYGTLLLCSVNLLLSGASMLFQIYLSNTIGAAGLGLLQLILSVGSMAIVLGTSGVRITAMYLSAEELGRKRPEGVARVLSACMRYGLALSLCAATVLFRLAPVLAERWIHDLRAASSLRILALFLPVTCLCSVMTGYFTAAGKIRELVCIEICERLACIGLTVLLLQRWACGELGRSCCAIVLGSCLAGTGCLASMLWLYLRGRPPLPQGEKRPVWRRLLRQSVPLALGDYARSGLSTTEQLLIPRGLAQYGGSTERSMAAYGAIHGMVFPAILFPACLLYALIDLLIPELSACHVAGHTSRIRALTDRCFRMTALYACVCAGFLHLLAQPLGALLYHNGEAGRYIALFAPLVCFLYVDAVVDGMLKGLGQQLYSVRCNMLTSALDVAGLLVLLPRLGIAGYFISFAATHLLNFTLSLGKLLRVTGCPLPSGFCVRLCLSFGGCVVLLRPLLQRARALPGLLAAAAVYFGVVLAVFWLTGALTREDFLWLRELIRRRPRRRAQAAVDTNDGSAI